MKHITILSAVALLLIFLPSCQKQTLTTNDNIVNDHKPLDNSVAEQTIISSWFPLQLSLTSDRNELLLKGIGYFDRKVEYDKALHVELAYVMIPGQHVSTYKRLPMKLFIKTDATAGFYAFQFGFEPSGFNLTIKNIDSVNGALNPDMFNDFQYRYIILPLSKYSDLSIDWENYYDVAQALNL